MKRLVIDLVRELQQYMLCHASGTTDQSSLQSNFLEQMELEAEEEKLPTEVTLQKITDFASSNFNLDLSMDHFRSKMLQMNKNVNLERIKASLGTIASMITQSDTLQKSIAQIQRRIQNELMPLTSK